ncbi:MAG: hypothetical protein ACM3JC_12835 [Rudaea sp.]
MHRVLTRVGIAAGWCVCLLIVACAIVEPAPDATALSALYEAAIRDAAIFDPANRAVLRTIANEDASATVVTWMRAQDAERDLPLGDVALAYDTWVTLDGDVRELCRRYDHRNDAGLTTRLQQLLGLPPAAESRVFVTLRAPVAAIFRPCLDPDVTRTTCDRRAFPKDVPVEHEAWVARQMVTSYHVGDAEGQPGGRPWTGLGYAYDWAPDSNHVGPSEFVVKAGTPVSVVAKERSSAYCAR